MQSNQSMAIKHREPSKKTNLGIEKLNSDPSPVLMPFVLPELSNLSQSGNLGDSRETLATSVINKNRTLIAQWLRFALTFNYSGMDQVKHFMKTESSLKKVKIINASIKMFEKKFEEISVQYNSHDYKKSDQHDVYSMSLDTIEDNDFENIVMIKAETIRISKIDLKARDTVISQLTYAICHKLTYMLDVGSVGQDISDMAGSEYIDDLETLQKIVKQGESTEEIYKRMTTTLDGEFYYIECHSLEELENYIDQTALLSLPSWYEPKHAISKEKTGTLQKWLKHYLNTPLCLSEREFKMLFFCEQAMKLIKRRERQKLNTAYSMDEGYDFYYPACFYHQLNFGFGLEDYSYQEVSDYSMQVGEVGMMFLSLKDEEFKKTHEILMQMAEGFSLINYLEEFI